MNVDIRIVNDKDEEVHTVTKSVSKDDFGNYINKTVGDQFLADVRLPASDISSGSSSNGTVYLIVYKENVVSFDEVNCSALFCLPVKDIQLTVKSLPIELSTKGYDGSIESKIRVEDVSYTFEKDFSFQLKITVSGTKTYGKSDSGYDIISYKLNDSKGYMIESGNVYLRSLTQGDKFQDDSITVFDITPGESYTLKFSEYNY